MGTGGGLVVIDFTGQGNSAHFRREGWSGQEPDRVWGVGPRSVLRVLIQSSARPMMLEAEIGPAVAPPAITGQIVRVQINGTPVGSVVLRTRTMIRCEIDPALVPADGVLYVEFGFPGFHRPESRQIPNDPRPLSGWFSFVRVYTTDLFMPGPHFPPSTPDIPVIDLPPPIAAAPDTGAPQAVYNFGRKGSILPWIRGGWDIGEDSFTWTTNASCQLELPAPRTPGTYGIRLDAWPFVSPGKLSKQDLTVLLDGILVGQFRVEDQAELVVPLPRELTEGRSFLALNFLLPDARRPSDLGISSDTRLLGMAFRRIAVAPIARLELPDATRTAAGPFTTGKPAAASALFDTAIDAESAALIRGFESGGDNSEFQQGPGHGAFDPGHAAEPANGRSPQADHGAANDQPATAVEAVDDAAGPGGPDVPPPRDPSPRDVADWVRNLRLPAPRDIRGLFLLLGQSRRGERLESLLKRIDFADLSSAEVFELVIGRPPNDRDFAAGTFDSDADTTFGRTVLSREFRERCMFAFLDAFPELARDIFIHVPKCAGTDLIMNLGFRKGLMTLPYMIRFPEWLPDDEFLEVLGGLARTAPFHDRVFVYGHMTLGEFPAGFNVRPNDKMFSIVRDPLASMVSHANYAVGRLRQDPAGRDPDTAETLSMLEMPSLPDGLSDQELKDLVVRVMFDPKIVFTNVACRHLGGGDRATFDDAFAQIVANDIEMTTTGQYEPWLEQRWGVIGSQRHNSSEPILTLHEAGLLYSEVIRDRTAEDAKLFNLVTWAIGQAGTPSVTGQQMMGLLPHGKHPVLAGQSAATDDAGGLFVLHDAETIARYTQFPSVVVPGGRHADQVSSLRFGKGDAGVRFLGTGWAQPEDGFTWTNGTESVLRLPPCPVGGVSAMRITGRPFIVEGRLPSQEITIFLNGQRIGTGTIHDVVLIEFEIPRAVIADRRPLVIKFVIPGASRPDQLKQIADDRLLGFSLETVTIINYTSEPKQRSAGPRAAASREPASA